MPEETPSATMKQKLAHEAKVFAALSVYLYICIGAILLFKAAVLRDQGVAVSLFGIAIVKAMILAKFLMLGEAVRAGERHQPKPLFAAVLHRSFVLLLVLFVLMLVEEWIVGLIHGHRLSQTVDELVGGRWREIVAQCVLMLLVLLPYVTMKRIREGLDDATWQRLLRGEA